MDLDEFRSVLMNSRVDVWTLIDTAISVASTDDDIEFKRRREAIVERLYTPAVSLCRNCEHNHPPKPKSDGLDNREKRSNGGEEKRGSPSSPESLDSYGEDDEQRRIIAIKEHLENPNQSEEFLVDLLRSLARMDITFKALKETDIGRHVNRLRKHQSNEVRRLVKQLVRNWKELVDEWVRLNTPGEGTGAVPSMAVGDGESPEGNHHHHPHHLQQKSTANAHHFPVMEQEKRVSPREASSRAVVELNKQREFAETERLASATKRLHENYQEAQNAKKQRTIQVMELHDIPKPKNTFFARSRGGVQAKDLVKYS